MKFIQRVHLLPCPKAGTKKKDEAYQTLQTVFFLTLICAISSRIVSHDAPLCFVAITLWELSTRFKFLRLDFDLVIRYIVNSKIDFELYGIETACWLSSMNFFER